MHSHDTTRWQHDHVFGQEKAKAGERRTLFVAILTAIMMIVEIAAGLIYGSMALLADGLHMASHATALAIAFFAYIYARRLAADRRFTFGTGKVNSLAGFGSAVLLGGFALVMVTESVQRLVNPISIAFDQALVVAFAGLMVNAVSAWLLAAEPHHHGADNNHDHDHAHEHGRHHDHNLRAAYLHVLADALTSLLAIAALLAGKYFNAFWLDPAMGVAGAFLVARWSYGLMRETAQVLLDRQADETVTAPLRRRLQGATTDRIVDLHVWSIGPGIRAAEIVIVSDNPKKPDDYKSLIPRDLNIVHAIVEVHRRPFHA